MTALGNWGTSGERNIPLRQRVRRGLFLLLRRPRLRVRCGLLLPRVRLRPTGHSGSLNAVVYVAVSTSAREEHPLRQLRRRSC
jgi:hypothetical protein